MYCHKLSTENLENCFSQIPDLILQPSHILDILGLHLLDSIRILYVENTVSTSGYDY